jgi:hypothetical protein
MYAASVREPSQGAEQETENPDLAGVCTGLSEIQQTELRRPAAVKTADEINPYQEEGN